MYMYILLYTVHLVHIAPSEAAHVQAKVIPSQPDPPVDTSPAIMGESK